MRDAWNCRRTRRPAKSRLRVIKESCAKQRPLLGAQC
uniref:Uncharacterized protein n=1 Tax=Arundo donax TaxID=35708 RepID=A0A0A9FLK8_ARUDO